MEFWYNVIESYCIDVDFQKIYDYIKEQEPNYNNYELFIIFIDNAGFYLRSIYGCEDLNEIDNECQLDILIERWEDWFKETFGENWDDTIQ